MSSPVPYQAPSTDKSVGVAFVLTFFFGPLGMLYTAVWPALIMIVAAIVLGFVTLGLALPFVWIATIVWACVNASKQHSRFLAYLAQSQSMTGQMTMSQVPQGGYRSVPGPISPPAVAPGWYPDPQSPGHHRWWDGANWTSHRSDQHRPPPPLLPPPPPPVPE